MARPGGFDDETLARIDEIAERAVEQGQVPGVVAGVARVDAIQVATAGMATVDGAPMRRDALVRISSATKPVTATAILSLIDEGPLNLDAAVDDVARALRTPCPAQARRPPE